MYRGYLQYMQNALPGTFSKRDCAKLVSEDIERWWGQTGIEIITQNGIIKKVLNIEDKYKRLKKHSERPGENVNKRDKFLKELKNTLWVVDKKMRKA